MTLPSRRILSPVLIPIAIFVASATFYFLLSAKELTWIYTSGDAGDWLSLLHWWYVPHTWGKPLLVLFIRFISLIPGDDIIKLTLGMAVLPGAATVTVTYLTAKHLTGKTSLAVVASLVLLGAVIFTTQATVVEQYVFSAMFLSIAFYWHVRNKKLLTLVFLGLYSATHETGFPITFLWLLLEWRSWKTWLKLSPAYITTGILSYGLIALLMASPNTPKLVAGGLSLGSLNVYFGNTATSASLSLASAPERIGQLLMIYTITMGLAIVPLIKGMYPMDKLSRLGIALIGFTIWFYLTTLFPSIWKWTTFILPIMAVFVAIGLSRLPQWHTQVVAIGAILLIVATGLFMNTDQTAKSDPQAMRYLEALEQLPPKSAVIVPRGGQYGFTLFYFISKGADIVPLANGQLYVERDETDKWSPEVFIDQSYADYLSWLDRTYGIKGDSVTSIVEDAIGQGYAIYYGQPQIHPVTVAKFKYDDSDQDKEFLRRVIGVNPDD